MRCVGQPRSSGFFALQPQENLSHPGLSEPGLEGTEAPEVLGPLPGSALVFAAGRGSGAGLAARAACAACAAEKERARNDTHKGTSRPGSELSQPQLVFSWQSHPGQAGGKQPGVVFSQPCPGQRSRRAPLAAVLGSHKDAPRGASGWYPSPRGGGLTLHGQTPLLTASGAGTDQAEPWERSF